MSIVSPMFLGELKSLVVPDFAAVKRLFTDAFDTSLEGQLERKGVQTRDAGKLPPGTQVFADLAAFAAHLAP
jgi:hypothetical protein